MRKRFWLILMLLAVLVAGGITLVAAAETEKSPAPQQPSLRDLALRVAMTKDDSESVAANLPIGIIRILHELLPPEKKNELSVHGINVDTVMEKFADVGPTEILSVDTDKEKVRIWTEQRVADERKAQWLNIEVKKKDPDEKKKEVTIKFPLAAAELAASLIPIIEQISHKDLTEKAGGINVEALIIKVAQELKNSPPGKLVSVNKPKETVEVWLE